MTWEIRHGDCVEVMKGMEDNSVDAVVCDPPYGLAFMGKEWDKYTPRDFQDWTMLWGKEAYRALKPGGHLLAFGGSRTYHRMASGIEDAGFEIRDQIMWVYGSGFPKSLNIGKAATKSGKRMSICPDKGNSPYEGWGTALKPSHEPIVVARKPLSEKTVAANVLRWGTGGLNVDGGRIKTKEAIPNHLPTTNFGGVGHHYKPGDACPENTHTKGRWPSNVILDEAAAKEMDRQSGEGKDGTAVMHRRGGNQFGIAGSGVEKKPPSPDLGYGGFGGASRFFYCAKASRRERNAGVEGMEMRARPTMGSGMGNQPNNHHPTVKPVSLMRYLVRLVTPPNGGVLDPFFGSGSTGIASILEGFNFIGIEMEEEYIPIATARLENAEEWGEDFAEPIEETAPNQMGLF